MGRPRGFSQDIADQICERMIEGEDLVAICKDEAMPSRATVYRWMAEQPGFETQCARAREGLADHDAHQIAQIADSCNELNAQSSRVKLAALQWLAAKRSPKRWGDKVEIDAKVEVTSAPTENLMAFLAMAETNGKKGN
jgi:hypothetical protein